MSQLSSLVVKELEAQIMDGSLLPGERLPSEEKLCARFSASRTVVREAIQQLRGRGLLRTLKGSGSYIADPSLEKLADAVATYTVLSESDGFLELMDFRILLETECARLAALNTGVKMLEMMEKSLKKMEAVRGDHKKFGEADIAFHLAIAAASKHTLYATVLSALEKHFIEYAHQNRGEEEWFDRVIETHREIYDAICDRSPERAAEAMKHHLILSRRHYVDLEK